MFKAKRIAVTALTVFFCIGIIGGCSGAETEKSGLADTGTSEEQAIDATAEESQSTDDSTAVENEAAQAEADQKAAEEAAAREEADRKAAEEAAAQAEAQRRADEEAAAQAEADKSERTVYITETGKKYHSAGCRHLKKSKTEISLSDAKAQGYDPCGTCNP